MSPAGELYFHLIQAMAAVVEILTACDRRDFFIDTEEFLDYPESDYLHNSLKKIVQPGGGGGGIWLQRVNSICRVVVFSSFYLIMKSDDKSDHPVARDH